MNLNEKTYVEPVEQENNTSEGLVKKIILVAALLVSIPLYLLFLFLVGDSLFWASSARGTAAGQDKKKIEVFKLGGMDFASMEVEQISSSKQLLESLVLTMNADANEEKRAVYLRVGSYENFTDDSLGTKLSRKKIENWQSESHQDTAKSNAMPTKKTLLQFFANFEGRLPYPPEILKLAGPLDFCQMADDSILFAYTIAAGDEFEVEYSDQIEYTGKELIAQVDENSPYLDIYPLSSYKLDRALEKILPETYSTASQTLLLDLMIKYLETNGVYTIKPASNYRQHPVEEFLDKNITGHCQHFAAAFVALCRLKGIPARVAAGFYSSTKRENKYLILNNMGHAWPEILTTEGWKIVPISPARSDKPKAIAKDVLLPTIRQLEEHAQKVKQKNRAGTDSKNAGEPQRNKSESAKEIEFEKTQNPGSVVKDKEKEEEFLRKKKKKESKEFRNKLAKFVLLVVVGSLLIWLIKKFGEKFFFWLLKWLKKALQKETPKQETVKIQTQELVEYIQQIDEEKLTGKNLTELFQVFSRIMETKGYLIRDESETPAEYFKRLCLELNINPAQGNAAADFFASEVYGHRKIDSKKLKKFLEILQLILTKTI